MLTFTRQEPAELRLPSGAWCDTACLPVRRQGCCSPIEWRNEDQQAAGLRYPLDPRPRDVRLALGLAPEDESHPLLGKLTRLRTQHRGEDPPASVTGQVAMQPHDHAGPPGMA